MANSPLLGTTPAPQEASGRDTRSLGPSDLSDTGSDLAGIDTGDDAALPLEEALQGAESPGNAPDIDTDREVTPHRGVALPADATEPPRPNPEPDAPAPTEPADPAAPPAEPEDAEDRKPGRTAALLRPRA